MQTRRAGENPVRLTRKEKQLLEILESHPGRCFSRPFLLRHVWGYSDEARTRTVDVHVSRLRKKLEERQDIAIHAVVRRGYMLERHAAATTA
jgi:DNA-binding response OmpR family regulator